MQVHFQKTVLFKKIYIFFKSREWTEKCLNKLHIILYIYLHTITDIVTKFQM